MKFKHAALAARAGACILLCSSQVQVAHAQPYPAKPVRMIVAFPPGGGTDLVARIIGPRLAEALGQSVIIDNRAGAAGLVGTEFAAKAPPDGYTVFLGTLGNLSVNPLLYSKLAFDIERDLQPVTNVVAVTFMLYVHPSVPARSVKDIIALAKARSGEINYASSGAGGAPHLGAELFNMMAGVRLVHVPYKGSGQSFGDLLGGHVPITFDSLVQGLQYVKDGRLRAIATLGAKRTPVLPDVPTVGETLPGYDVTNWFGLVTQAAVARETVNRLQADVGKVLRLPDVRDRLLALGAEPIGDTPEQFGAFMKSETAKWARVIQQAKIRAD
ncbi:MAG: tripartite tricarboxylate transporter substrate binding protein [Proteobacteria bacterium]|nr:tripartite tricarboxylate transporter substrate binding protein [Burkholderiales bacterium]